MITVVAAGSDLDPVFVLIDFTNSKSPILHRLQPDPARQFTGCRVALDGPLLAVGEAQGHNVTVLDVTNPAAPVNLGLYQTLANGVGAIAISGRRVAIGEFSNSFGARVFLLDFTTTGSPSLVGTATTTLAGTTSSSAAITSAALIGDNIVIVAGGANFGSVKVDFSNPAHPTLQNFNQFGFGGTPCLDASGSVMAAGDGNGDSVKFFNALTPAQPISVCQTQLYPPITAIATNGQAALAGSNSDPRVALVRVGATVATLFQGAVGPGVTTAIGDQFGAGGSQNGRSIALYDLTASPPVAVGVVADSGADTISTIDIAQFLPPVGGGGGTPTPTSQAPVTNVTISNAPPPTTPLTVRLYWTIGAKSSSTIITQYRAANQTAVDGGPYSVPGAGGFTPISAGLQYNTAYIFKLVAHGAQGSSSPVWSPIITTPQEEAPVTNVFVALSGLDGIWITWSPGSGSTLTEVTRFRVAGRQILETTYSVAGSTIVDAGDLQIETSYVYQLVAVGPNGRSQPVLSVPIGLPYAGITAVSSRSQFGDAINTFAHCYAFDYQHKIQIISRQDTRAWNGAGTADGVFIDHSVPGVVYAAVNQAGTEYGNVISCALGTDLACYVLENPTFAKSYSLGGSFAGSPLLTSWPDGRCDVFCLGFDDHLHQQTADGNLHWAPNWTDLGLIQFTPSAAISCAANLIDIAGTDPASRHHLFSYNGTGWSTMDLAFTGPQQSSRPVLASSAPGQLDVFAVGQDFGLYHRSRSGASWSGWELVGKTLVSWARPAVASWGSNRLDVVCVGTDNALYHKFFDGQRWNPVGLTNWIKVGGLTPWGIGPALAAPAQNHLELFVKGTDRYLYSASFDGSTWTGFAQHAVTLP